ncbi:hypothetical protein ALC60_01558 [Trachymyrmex zeteki]|uniref:Uncharacterized protein n=1 Tax=Mycetomoellerius zeteki TaxID=64791 RepID=A0A151XG76_9HYME|nr:hypothetical protein ALC60_01558 [Trachymyrmex zeteki]
MCGIFLDPPYAPPRGHSFAALATFHVSARYWKRSSLFKDIFRRLFLLRVYFFVARSVTHDAYRPLFYLSNIVYFTHAVYMRSNDIGHSRSRFLATRNSIVSYRRDVGARDMEMSVRDTSAHLDTSVAFRPNYTVNFTRYRMAAFHLSTVTTYTVNARASGVRIAEYKT